MVFVYYFVSVRHSRRETLEGRTESSPHSKKIYQIMGKIYVKAQQQNVFNKDKSGEISKAYVLRPIRYSTMNSDDILDYCVKNSIVPKAYISASMIALSQCIENFLLNGHSVEFPQLGIFSLSSLGISESDLKKTGIAQLHKLRVRFLPCSQLRTAIERVNVAYDGAYDIAGVNEKGLKYYKKVAAGTTTEPPVTEPDPDESDGPDII